MIIRCKIQCIFRNEGDYLHNFTKMKLANINIRLIANPNLLKYPPNMIPVKI